jgi:hypothetical protein
MAQAFLFCPYHSICPFYTSRRAAGEKEILPGRVIINLNMGEGYHCIDNEIARKENADTPTCALVEMLNQLDEIKQGVKK